MTLNLWFRVVDNFLWCADRDMQSSGILEFFEVYVDYSTKRYECSRLSAN